MTAPVEDEAGRFERLAIIFSDGSVVIGTEKETLAQIQKQCAGDNKNETRPGKLARVARVRIEIIEFVADEQPAHNQTCPTCGRERA